MNDNYSLILQNDEHVIFFTLINSIQKCCYNMEIKLKLIENYVPVMDFDTIDQLLKTFESILE